MLKKFLILGIIFSPLAYAWKSSSWSSSSSSSLKSSIGSSYNASYYTHNPTGKQVMDMATGKTGWGSGESDESIYPEPCYLKCYTEIHNRVERYKREQENEYNKNFNDFHFKKQEKKIFFSVLAVCLTPFLCLGICETISKIFKI